MKKLLLLPMLTIALHSHADNTPPTEHLDLPDASAISAVLFAQVPNILMTRPISAMQVFSAFADKDEEMNDQEPLGSRDPQTIAAIMDSLAKLPAQHKNANPPQDRFAAGCQYSTGHAIIALVPKNGNWLLISQGCMEETKLLATYKIPHSQWQTFTASVKKKLRRAQ